MVTKQLQGADPTFIRDKVQALLDFELSRGENYPPKPVIAVNDTRCKIRSNAGVFRNLFIIPWFLALCWACWSNIDDFLESWRATERSTLSYITARRNMYGEEYFKVTNDPLQKQWYNDVGPDEKMSFHEYLHCRYNNYVTSKTTLIADIVFGVFFLIAIPGLFFWIIRFRRRSLLIFDRERKLVTYWYFGKVMVQRFDDLQIQELSRGLLFVLRGINPKTGELAFYHYAVQPGGSPIVADVSTYAPLLAFITQYMEHGREKLLPDGPFKKFGGFYFFDDKKPYDYEDKIAATLKLIDQEKMTITFKDDV